MDWTGKVIAVNVDVPELLHKAMKKMAVDRDTTSKELYAEAVAQFLKAAGFYPVAPPERKNRGA